MACSSVIVTPTALILTTSSAPIALRPPVDGSIALLHLQRVPTSTERNETTIDEAEKSRDPTAQLGIFESAPLAKQGDGCKTLNGTGGGACREVMLARNGERFCSRKPQLDHSHPHVQEKATRC